MKFLSQINVNTEYTLPMVDGTNGQVLSTDGEGVAYWGTISAGSLTLDGLSDVSIVSLSSDQMIRYGLRQGDTVPVWHNFTPSFLTPSSSINALNDVVITTAAAGQILRYNGSNWVNFTHSFLTSLPAHNHNDIYYTEGEIDSFFAGENEIDGYNRGAWDIAYNDKINSATFSTTTGVLTLTQQDTGTVTVDLDGRYLESLPAHTHAASDITSGTLSTDRLPKQELGISIVGNFGQWQLHSAYTNFNTAVNYWGWNYVQGSTNAPHQTSSQWYRGRFSLGNEYGFGSDGGDYWMEIAIPRYYQNSNAGNLFVRTAENGVINGWQGVRAAYATDAGYAEESGHSLSSGSVEWTNVQNKPATFPPSAHNHDDRYYTETESDSRFYLATNPNGYISGISFANVSSKPTTIAGYGITDAITTTNIASQSVAVAAVSRLVRDTPSARITTPEGAYSVGNSSGTGGAIKISLPTAVYNNNTMMSMTVEVYLYSTGQSFTLRIGGYNYSDGAWYNVFASILSDSGKSTNVPVYFGNNGVDRNVIWIGDSNSTWDYPNVFVTDFQSGHSQNESWAKGWSVSFSESEQTNLTASRIAYRQVDAGNIGSYALTSLPAHTHTIANVTGLQTALDGKLSAEADTLSTVTGRGDSTTTALYLAGGSGQIPALHIRSGGSSWSEGLAIHPSTNNGYALSFYRTRASYTDQTNTWGLGNLGDANALNHFGLLRNGLTGGIADRSGDAVFTINPTGVFKFGFNPYVGGNVIWHAGNDGDGSGLDADSVDGVHASNIVWGNAKGTNDSVTTDADGLDKTGFYTSSAFVTRPEGVDNWMYIQHIKLYNSNSQYQKQIGYDTYDDRMWVRTKSGNTWSSWKAILTSENIGEYALTSLPAHTHTIANVTGLQTALDGKLSTSGTAANSTLFNGLNFNGVSARFQSDLNTLGLSGTSGVYNIGAGYTNGPAPALYGTLLAFWNSDISVQFWATYNGDFYWRKSVGASFTGSTWRTIWDTSHFTSTDVSNWNTAYGWGDHATAGYLTSFSYTETDTLSSVTGRGGSTGSPVVMYGKVTLGNNSSGTYSGNTNGLTLNSTAEVRSTSIQFPPALTWHYEGLATRHLLMTSGGAFNFVSPSNEASGVAVVQVNGNTVWHAGNLTNLNQLTNGPGYITGYTETDTLSSVTGRGASTSTNITLTGSGNTFNGHHYFSPYDANGNHYPHYNPGSNGNGSKLNLRMFDNGGDAVLFHLNGSSKEISWNGSTIWHSGNDGSTSGLDADLLDGYHGTSFIRIAANSNSPTNASFAIGTASSRNFIQSHAGQPLDINPLGNAVNVGSDLTVSGSITENSSIRYKKDIIGIESTSDRVELLKPVRYKKIENEVEEIGLVAEDVAELFPEVVKYDNEGRPDGINYSRLSVILLKAVQELTERVNKLENK